jgi:NAD(P)-dependent dehydrogenase (short-subunit alcohol dehydrogenase family)
MLYRVALITGGGQGIGRAIAQRLIDNDWRVALAEIDEEAGCEAKEELGERTFFIQTDVGKEDDVIQCVAKLVDKFGRLDGLVNNAAIGAGKPIEDLSLAEWNRVIAVNLTGAFLCAREAVSHLRKTNGAIVNIASTRALQSEANTEAYSASKGGLVALTHALAVSLGPQVRVNCISPGWIETAEWKKRALRSKPDHTPQDLAQHPCGRVGTPEDIAAMVQFLLSDESGFITGANFTIDGGMTRKMIYEE